MEDRSEEIKEIVEKIDRYLEGQLGVSDIAGWGLLKITEDPVPSYPPTEHDLLVGEGWGALAMLSESEPEEFRTTQEQLIQIRRYLTGEDEYPYKEKLSEHKS
jgi:hypothetical protein